MFKLLLGLVGWLTPALLSAQAFPSPDAAWAWYKALDPRLQQSLRQEHRFTDTQKDSLWVRLPIIHLDLQAVGGGVNLNQLNALASLQRLALPYFPDSLGPLTDGSFAQLLALDAAGSTLQSKDLFASDLPLLRSLNIAETDIRDLHFLERFPALDTLIIANGQLSSDVLALAQRRYKSLFILYRGTQKLLPRKFTQAELSTWIAEKLTYPPQARKAGIAGRIDIRFTILPNGRVSAISLQNSLGGGLDEEALRVVGRLRFQPGPAPMPRTAYIYFR